MLIYIVVMLALAAFLYRESEKIVSGESILLRELCQSPYAAKAALSAMRIVLLTACVSAFLMLVCFLLSKIFGFMPKPVAALSILCYSAGFICAMCRLRRI